MNSHPRPAPILEREPTLGWTTLISFGSHIALFAILCFLPGLSQKVPAPSPVYMVDLVSLAMVGGPASSDGSSDRESIKTLVPRMKARKIAVMSQEEIEEKTRPIPMVKAVPLTKTKVKPVQEAAKVDRALDRIRERKEDKAHTERDERDRIEDAIKRMAAERASAERSREPAPKPRAVERTAPPRPVETARQAAVAESAGSSSALSSGSDAEEGSGGVPAAVLGLRLQAYKTQIWDKVRNNWSFPQAMESRGNPRAMVRIKVRSDGSILDTRVVLPSGDRRFDESVFRAVQLSDPLPPFPEGYVKSHEEIELTFTLEGMNRG